MTHYLFYSSSYLYKHITNNSINTLDLLKDYSCHGDCVTARSEKSVHLIFSVTIKNLYCDLKKIYGEVNDNQFYHLFIFLLNRLWQTSQMLMPINHSLSFVGEDGTIIKHKGKNLLNFCKELMENIDKEVQKEAIIKKYLKPNYSLQKLANLISYNERLSFDYAKELAAEIINNKEKDYELALKNSESRMFNFFIDYKINPNEAIKVLSDKPGDIVLNVGPKSPYFYCHPNFKSHLCPNED
ncbi:MAG: hypothetical protein FWE37_09275 [Spirochaetaceae bacterium]|nr:hypothetical protein [Spirochaetaceae bacterium]